MTLGTSQTPVRWMPVASAPGHLIHDREDKSHVDAPAGCPISSAQMARLARAPCRGMLVGGQPSSGLRRGAWCGQSQNLCQHDHRWLWRSQKVLAPQPCLIPFLALCPLTHPGQIRTEPEPAGHSGHTRLPQLPVPPGCSIPHSCLKCLSSPFSDL
jgi:hypothetical protein